MFSTLRGAIHELTSLIDFISTAITLSSGLCARLISSSFSFDLSSPICIVLTCRVLKRSMPVQESRAMNHVLQVGMSDRRPSQDNQGLLTCRCQGHFFLQSRHLLRSVPPFSSVFWIFLCLNRLSIKRFYSTFLRGSIL